MGKNIQSISRLLWESPHAEHRNEPPLDSLELRSPNHFMASPSPDPIQRLAIKGFWTQTPDTSSGGSFRSSGWRRSHGSPEIPWDFFCYFKTCCRAVSLIRPGWGHSLNRLEIDWIFFAISISLLAEYYGQSENHFFKCAYGTMAILQTWKPFCKVAPITVICPLFKKLFPFFETWFPYFTKWLSNWCHYTLSILQTWFPFLKKWMTYS